MEAGSRLTSVTLSLKRFHSDHASMFRVEKNALLMQSDRSNDSADTSARRTLSASSWYAVCRLLILEDTMSETSPAPAPPPNPVGPAAAPDPSKAMTLFVMIVATLYFGREVLVPVTLALLLAFILAPVVELLRRAHLGRVPSVLLRGHPRPECRRGDRRDYWQPDCRPFKGTA